MTDGIHSAFRAQLVVPEQRQFYDYWLGKAAERPMPDRKDIRPTDFPRLLPYVSLIEAESCGRLRVRLAGTKLRDVYDREITGHYLDEFDADDRREYWAPAYARILQDGKPSQGVMVGPRSNKEHLVQYWLRLPLSVAGRRTGMILCHDAFLVATGLNDDTVEALSA